MKRFFLNRCLGPACLSLTAMLLGLLAGGGLPPLSSFTSPAVLATVSQDSAAEFLPQVQDSPSTRFVQEPSDRTSFRPDFSAGLRRAHQRGNYAMLRAFHDAVGEARRSTVQLSSGRQQVALGAIVASDGWIVTKASQLPAEGELHCRLYDNSEYLAEVVQQSSEMDLALLHIDCSELPVVPWDAADIPARGAWLATTDVDQMPSAVGVVSAGVQRILRSKAVLGVNLVDSAEGPAVTLVLPGSGADEAGLKKGDNIVAINDVEVRSQSAFRQAIESAQGGELVQLRIHRGERKFTTHARLMDLAEELLDETEMDVNGRVSARATGFQRVFLHDTVLDPTQCGGPLCNLDGKVVGLNIARASRVSSYALPADVVRPALEGLLAQARLVSRAAKPAEVQPIR